MMINRSHRLPLQNVPFVAQTIPWVYSIVLALLCDALQLLEMLLATLLILLVIDALVNSV